MTEPAHVLGVLFATMERLITNELTSVLAEFELSETQYRALRFLRHAGGAELAGLAAALTISPPAATKLADRLQRGGWLARHGVETDRRRTLLMLTDSAEAALAGLDLQSGRILESVFSELGPDQQEQLLHGVSSFLRIAVGRLPAGQPCLFCGEQHQPDCPLNLVEKKDRLS